MYPNRHDPEEILDYFKDVAVNGATIMEVSFAGEEAFAAYVDINTINVWEITNGENQIPMHVHPTHVESDMHKYMLLLSFNSAFALFRST